MARSKLPTPVMLQPKEEEPMGSRKLFRLVEQRCEIVSCFACCHHPIARPLHDRDKLKLDISCPCPCAARAGSDEEKVKDAVSSLWPAIAEERGREGCGARD